MTLYSTINHFTRRKLAVRDATDKDGIIMQSTLVLHARVARVQEWLK